MLSTVALFETTFQDSRFVKGGNLKDSSLDKLPCGLNVINGGFRSLAFMIKRSAKFGKFPPRPRSVLWPS